jgi:hypothetical protein
MPLTPSCVKELPRCRYLAGPGDACRGETCASGAVPQISSCLEGLSSLYYVLRETDFTFASM